VYKRRKTQVIRDWHAVGDAYNIDSLNGGEEPPRKPNGVLGETISEDTGKNKTLDY
jgi:hypothetical protein